MARPEGHAVGSAGGGLAGAELQGRRPILRVHQPEQVDAHELAGIEAEQIPEARARVQDTPLCRDLADRVARALGEAAKALVRRSARLLGSQAAQRGGEDLGDQLEAGDVLVAPLPFDPVAEDVQEADRTALALDRDGEIGADSGALEAAPLRLGRRRQLGDARRSDLAAALDLAPRPLVLVHHLFEAAGSGAPRNPLAAPLEDSAVARALGAGGEELCAVGADDLGGGLQPRANARVEAVAAEREKAPRELGDALLRAQLLRQRAKLVRLHRSRRALALLRVHQTLGLGRAARRRLGFPCFSSDPGGELEG